MLAYALSGGRNASRDVKRLVWSVEPLAWSRELYALLLPAAQIVVANLSAAEADRCRIFRQTAPGAYFSKPAAVLVIRERVHRACGLPPRPRASFTPPSLLYMPRTGRALQSGSKRNFVGDAAILREIGRALPSAVLRTTPTPGALVPLCEQVRLWATADIVLTPNGAHFVNAPFMATGAQRSTTHTRPERGHHSTQSFSADAHSRVCDAAQGPFCSKACHGRCAATWANSRSRGTRSSTIGGSTLPGRRPRASSAPLLGQVHPKTTARSRSSAAGDIAITPTST